MASIDLKGQLSLRGILIGLIGCVVITAASVYMALKMGALPWPIVFAAIISLFFLRLCSHGKATLNEANVTHTLMSAGAMVAGGLAFTLPGIWMLGLADNLDPLTVLIMTLCGVTVGLFATALLRRHFIGKQGLEFPIGEAAAQTLKAAGDSPSLRPKLFGAMSFAGIYGFLRDGLGVLPSIIGSLNIPGVAFGIYNSPMMLAVGFLVGTGAVALWFLGAIIGNFGIIVLAPALGFCDVDTASAITASLGMGLMVGSGVGVILRDIIPQGIKGFRQWSRSAKERGNLMGLSALPQTTSKTLGLIIAVVVGLGILAAVLCLCLQMNPFVCLLVILATIITCAMATQSVGQTGIDPMEIFGLIVLLLVAALGNANTASLFLIAAFVAIAAGLAGDVMNDFHAGYRLGTSPKAQWIAQAIGAFVGALVALGVMGVLFNAYGPEAFGPGREFVAAQASVVATTVSGIPSPLAFGTGVVAGIGLFLLRIPSMMLGLGVYLPFYMSFTAFLGSMVAVVYRRIRRGKPSKSVEDPEVDAQKRATIEEDGLIVASGLLGGESIIGICLAIFVALGAFF